MRSDALAGVVLPQNRFTFIWNRAMEDLQFKSEIVLVFYYVLEMFKENSIKKWLDVFRHCPKKYNLHHEWSGCIGTLVSTYMTGTQTRQVPLHPVHPSMTGSTYIRRFRFLWEIPLYLQLFFCFQVCLFICVHCTEYYLFNKEGSTMKVTVLFTLPLPQSNLTYHNNLQ